MKHKDYKTRIVLGMKRYGHISSIRGQGTNKRILRLMDKTGYIDRWLLKAKRYLKLE